MLFGDGIVWDSRAKARLGTAGRRQSREKRCLAKTKNIKGGYMFFNRCSKAIVQMAIRGPIYIREERDGKYTGQILEYYGSDYFIIFDLHEGLLVVVHTHTTNKDTSVRIVEPERHYLLLDEFNKTWSTTKKALERKIT